jgi:GTPase
MEATQRAGFVTVLGRPNVGKSTLINSMVGEKVAITSHHPNTTRNPIRGILTRNSYQIVFVDTPGVHKPRTLLGRSLNQVVAESAEESDLILLCLAANEIPGSGDAFILSNYIAGRKFVVAVTKIDTVANLPAQLLEIDHFLKERNCHPLEIVPLSAIKGEQTQLLADLIARYLPESPALYPEDATRDQALELTISEYIREAAILDLLQELPHSVYVTVDEIAEREGKNFFDIHASIHVERDSQKGILLANNRIKSIGSAARRDIEKLLGAKIFLGLHVKVTKEWQRDPKALQRFGFIQ